MKVFALITAAGSGKRMGGPKQFIELGGQPLLRRTIEAFNALKEISGIIVVVEEKDIDKVKGFGIEKVMAVVSGGPKRRDSVHNGLKVLPADVDIVLIHDGARPLVSGRTILDAVKAAEENDAAVVGVPVKDTIKKVKNNLKIVETLDRGELWAAQTPQAFKKDIIIKAYQQTDKEKIVTDDSSLVERTGGKVKMIMGSYDNIKITTKEDLVLAEKILQNKKEIK